MLLAAWIAVHPGTRPAAWWSHDAPRWQRADQPEAAREITVLECCDPRRRLGGVGDPEHLHLNTWPQFPLGLPDVWVQPWQIEYYNGRAEDIHGNPIGTNHHEGDFVGVAIDPNDPPRFESEASCLERHELLLPGERRRLTAEDFDPETVTDDADDDGDTDTTMRGSADTRE